jgi:hypothetical protein
MNMKSVMIRSHDEGASNGGGGESLIAVELAGRRIYLEHSYGWYDQSGDEENSHADDSYRIVSIDKEPFRETELPKEVKAFLEQFAKNGFQGELELKITQNARGRFVDGVEGFTQLVKQEVSLNPVINERSFDEDGRNDLNSIRRAYA